MYYLELLQSSREPRFGSAELALVRLASANPRILPNKNEHVQTKNETSPQSIRIRL
jgi:hypothetical protein